MSRGIVICFALGWPVGFAIGPYLPPYGPWLLLGLSAWCFAMGALLRRFPRFR